MNQQETQVPWHASGLLFENCNCQVVCPGHVHFDQDCTHDRCVGYWAIRFESGAYGDTSIAGTSAVISYDSPRHMIDGGWIENLIIDAAATEEQRVAIERILTGAAGGPWQKLGQFVGVRGETKFAPIHIEETETTKSVSIAGILSATIERLRGRDREQPVTFHNMFNQIHNPTQVIATGETKYDDGTIVVDTSGTHSLYSNFEWSVAG